MANRSLEPEVARARLLTEALTMPEAWEDHPWDERVVKVGKKIFLFGGSDGWHEGPMITLKLAASQPMALAQPGVVPSGYGLGRAGWVTVKLRESTLPFEALREWVDESYRLVAPKRLAGLLEADPSRLEASS